MNFSNDDRIAWLFPSLKRGFYWQPVLSEFTKRFPQTKIYTGNWPGFVAGFEDKFTVEVVGKTKFVSTTPSAKGYSRGSFYVSPKIVGTLLKFKPQVIFAVSFSAWTLLAVLLKAWARWRVVIVYNGSSPNVDRRDSKVHLFYRRRMAQLADALITNSQAGKAYLTEVIGAKDDCVFARPYGVPTPQALLEQQQEAQLSIPNLQHPIFLFIGVIEYRKGLQFLLESCNQLQKQGYRNYTVLVVGEGAQREELKVFIKNHNLEDCIHWAGWVDYAQLGAYFAKADVFVFPTLEDIWGMVLLEAMACGKPVLCSKWAGAKELVVAGENGYIFDPYHPEELAELMRRFLDNCEPIAKMGEKSKQLIAPHTPEAAAEFLAEVTSFVMK
ncbi:MAG TPA: glycosyl transferase [Cyanobacteria bacterium UBA8803]|nr:glycosyl transferase [Cyanobacteria bacterium UBA8803]